MLPTVSTATNKKSRLVPVLLLALLAGCAPDGARLVRDGEKLIQAGRATEAVGKLEAARDLLPQDARVWNHLGLAYHAAGRTTNALQAYQRALALDRNLFAARFNLGCLHLERNDVAGALAELTTFTQMKPDAKAGWLQLATAQYRHRRIDDAERSLTRADAKDPATLNLAGLIQLSRRRSRDALGYFDEALKKNPAYAPALWNAAVTLHQQAADRPAALARYRSYLALNPRPANWEVVNTIALQLDRELNPPARNAPALATTAPATNAAPAPSTASTVAPAFFPTTARTNPPPATASVNTNRSTTPAPPVMKAPTSGTEKTNPPAVAASATPPMVRVPTNPQPVQVVNVTAEGPIAKARDPERAPPSVTTTPSPAMPVEKTPAKVSTAAAPPPRTPFIQRLNPVRWFGGARTERTEKNPGPVSPPTTGKPVTQVARVAMEETPPADPAPRPATIARYQYLRPAKPRPGNRAEAKRFFDTALADQRADRLTQAVTGYLAATQADPSFYEAHYNLGLAAIDQGHFVRALSAYEHALSINPTSADARFNFALALQRANFPRDAANELEKILAEAPAEARAHLTLANLLAQELGDTRSARAHYLQFLQLDPGHAQASAVRSWLVAHP